MSVLERLFLDRHLELLLGDRWSLREVRDKVTAVIEETHDTKTFVLRPNAHWQGHRAGKPVTVAGEIDGGLPRRCYSVSSAPGESTIRITVKRAGLVSALLHDQV